MASKYIVILLILCVTGFFTLGIKWLLLLRPGFRPNKKPFSWIMIGLLAILTLCLISCDKKPTETAGEEEVEQKEPVIVGQEEEKTREVHKHIDGSGNVTATVTTSTKNDNDEIFTEEKTLTGSRQEVDAQIKALDKEE